MAARWLAAFVFVLPALAGCTSHLTCPGNPPSTTLVNILSTPDAPPGTYKNATDGALAIDGMKRYRCRADKGDQVSQYVIGYALEHGIGTPVNVELALKYYKKAAAARSNKTYVYSPPVGSEGSGRVLPVTLGPGTPGLPAAIQALKRFQKTGD